MKFHFVHIPLMETKVFFYVKYLTINIYLNKNIGGFLSDYFLAYWDSPKSFNEKRSVYLYVGACLTIFDYLPTGSLPHQNLPPKHW